MATVFVAFLTMFSEFGLGPAVVQRRDIDDPLLKRVFGVILIVHASLTLVLVLAAPLIAEFYREPRVASVVRVLSLQFMISAFVVIPDAMLQRRMEFKHRSLLDFRLRGSLSIRAKEKRRRLSAPPPLSPNALFRARSRRC